MYHINKLNLNILSLNEYLSDEDVKYIGVFKSKNESCYVWYFNNTVFLIEKKENIKCYELYFGTVPNDFPIDSSNVNTIFDVISYEQTNEMVIFNILKKMCFVINSFFEKEPKEILEINGVYKDEEMWKQNKMIPSQRTNIFYRFIKNYIKDITINIEGNCIILTKS